MEGKITKRQGELLSFIYNSFNTNGYPPSFDDIKHALNISSNQAVIDHLNSLEKKGYIKREEKSARGIKISPLGYQLLEAEPLFEVVGVSYAGTFTESFQLQGRWLELSNQVKQLSDQVYVIEISGDSMINAGINDGDKLLVQEQEHFKSGDIVLALSQEGTTVKRFIRQNKPPFIFLKPENPKYTHISFTEEVKMQGKIIGKLVSNQWQQLTQGRFL